MTIKEDTVKELYVERGLSQREIANRLGYDTKWPVRKAINKFGIKSKSKGGKNKDEQWKDEETLRELYHGKSLSTKKIGEKFGVSGNTIVRWLKNNDIEIRYKRQRHISLFQLPHWKGGYECWSDGSHTPLVHRLAAIAWFGLDEVLGKEIHHQNGIPWDNREENLKPLTTSEHMKLHAEKRDNSNNLVHQ